MIARWFTTVLAGAVLVGCGPAPVEWKGSRSMPGRADAIALTGEGEIVADSMALRAFTLPGVACPGSVRLARSGRLFAAVWWSVRADSGARLLAAHSTDGGATWSAASPVDTLDRGVSGCRRAPASVAVDSLSGYVHVTYGLVAPEGAGIFFAHSMDTGATFHAPVPIVYGDHPGYSSVSASGDVVAVAFEDPNGSAARIGLALSRTMGHIFEDRLGPVSDDNATATQPLVAVMGRRIAVAWREGAGARADTVLRIRVGLLH